MKDTVSQIAVLRSVSYPATRATMLRLWLGCIKMRVLWGGFELVCPEHLFWKAKLIPRASLSIHNEEDPNANIVCTNNHIGGYVLEIATNCEILLCHV